MGHFLKLYELSAVLAFYTAAYENNHPEIKTSIYTSDGQKIFIAEDGAAVIFNLDAAIFGNQKERIAVGSLGNNIVNRILDYVEAIVYSRLEDDNIPDKLRVCLAICHQNSHWTGLTAEINGLKELCLEAKAYWAENKILYDNNVIRIRTAIRDMFKVNPKNEMAEYKKKLAEKFHGSIAMEAYDSKNSPDYFKRVRDSLLQFNAILGSEVYLQECSPQRDCTCGDHTVINMVGVGLLDMMPNLVDRTVNSADLREFSSFALNAGNTKEEKTERAGKMLKLARVGAETQIMQQRSAEKELSELEKGGALDEGVDLVGLQKYLQDMVERLFKYDPVNATQLIIAAMEGKQTAIELFNSLHGRKGFGALFAFMSHDKEILTTVTTLVDVFAGENNESTNSLYRSFGIKTAEEKLGYTDTVRTFATEKYQDMEEEKFHKDFARERAEQEAAFKRFEK